MVCVSGATQVWHGRETVGKEYIFKPLFFDRKGRTVFNVHERSTKEKRYYTPGQLVGQARFKPGKDESIEIEWVAPDLIDDMEALPDTGINKALS